jgi:hypothetical protein
MDDFLLKFWYLSGAKECKSCRSRKMLQNDYLVAIVAVHTAENEPLKVWGWFHSFFNPLLNTYPNTYTLRCAARSAAICAASYAAFCRSNTSPHRDAARKASMFLLARASLVISSYQFHPIPSLPISTFKQ